jgi:hypothetical protein
MKKLLLFCFSIFFLSACDKSPNFLTIQAYGCEDNVDWNTCNGKPKYLGEIRLIISKEGKSVKMTQKSDKQVGFFNDGTFVMSDCVITDSYNWSCKEKSQYGELYFIKEMVNGLFFSTISGEYIKGSGLSYVGYQGIKGMFIKNDLWHPNDYFKAGKKEN